MQGLPRFDDANLLIGAEHFSDAGVYRIAPDQAIVLSVDFFPPVVNDPYAYGQIAAANAMSDIYATGGRPVCALNIVSFPDDELPMTVLHEILRGGAERVKAAGAVVVGGHSVREPGIQYGLSVTGTVHPDRIMSNRAAQPGQALVLTKALGTGFVSTAHRDDRCPQEALDAACASMIALNREASEAAVDLGVRAATDVTGFGLAGHAFEMAEASDVTLVFDLSALPLLPGVQPLARGNVSRSNTTNRAHVEAALCWTADEHDARSAFLFDPQTSGGLLVAIDESRADELVARCHAAGLNAAARVGRVEAASHARLVIEP